MTRKRQSPPVIGAGWSGSTLPSQLLLMTLAAFGKALADGELAVERWHGNAASTGDALKEGARSVRSIDERHFASWLASWRSATPRLHSLRESIGAATTSRNG